MANFPLNNDVRGIWTPLPNMSDNFYTIKFNFYGHFGPPYLHKNRRSLIDVRKKKFIFYEKSNGYFLKYVLLFKDTFMKALEAFSFAKWIAKRNWKFFLVVKPVEKSVGYTIYVFYRKCCNNNSFFDWFYWIHIFLLMDIEKTAAENLNMKLAPDTFFLGCWKLLESTGLMN